MNKKEGLQERLNLWLEGVKIIKQEAWDRIDIDSVQKTEYPYSLIVQEGKKWIKIVEVSQSQKIVYAFIDPITGDIYKPASWAIPAKNIRGNLFDKDNGLDCAGPYGIAYIFGRKQIIIR